MMNNKRYIFRKMSIGNMRTYQQIVNNLCISGGYVCGYTWISKKTPHKKLLITCG